MSVAQPPRSDSERPVPTSKGIDSGHEIKRFRWSRLRKTHFVAIVSLHVAALFAPFHFSWSGLAILCVLTYVSMSFGTSMGFHRLLTHRAFKTSRPMRLLLATFGTLAWQGGPLWWVGTHRLHHAESDTEKDPHSPHHGFAWGHMLWCLVEDPFGRNAEDAAKDLARDPVLVWLDKYFYVPNVVLAAVLFAFGGWSWVLWGVALRVSLTYHSTWFVNSASHMWGYRNFDTKEKSRNNWWVAIISWGEGWHNNHHAYQRSATFSFRWWEVDMTWWAICGLQKLGLVWDVNVPDVRLDRPAN